MKKFIIIFFTLFLVGCQNAETVEFVEGNDLEIEILDENVPNDEQIEEEPLEEIEVDETLALPVLVSDEVEIRYFKQRFLTLKMVSSVDDNLDEQFYENLETIKLLYDDTSDEGYMIRQNLLDFIQETDKNFANLDDGYLMVVNKSQTLPFDYVPANLVVTTVEGTVRMELEEETHTALKAMFDDAKKDGITLVLTSAYRDFERQEYLFLRQIEKRGGSYELANQYVACPGESEHQTGFVVDITCASVGFTLEQNFENTDEFKWLDKNAHNYGFIMRYPSDKTQETGYTYEPWHYRYVGSAETATYIKENSMILEDYMQKGE